MCVVVLCTIHGATARACYCTLRAAREPRARGTGVRTGAAEPRHCHTPLTVFMFAHADTTGTFVRVAYARSWQKRRAKARRREQGRCDSTVVRSTAKEHDDGRHGGGAVGITTGTD